MPRLTMVTSSRVRKRPADRTARAAQLEPGTGVAGGPPARRPGKLIGPLPSISVYSPYSPVPGWEKVGGMMTFRFSRLCLRLPCALLVAAVAGGVVGAAAGAQAATDPDARARAIVSQMTLDEKVLEMHRIGGAAPNGLEAPAGPVLGHPAVGLANR